MNSCTDCTGNDEGTDHDVRKTHHKCDRRGIAPEIKRQLLVEGRADGGVGCSKQQGIAIRRRLEHSLDAQISAHARTVLNDKGLAEAPRQPVGHKSRDKVRPSACRQSDADDDWARWIMFAPKPSKARQPGRLNPQLDSEIADGNFHCVWS